MTKVNKKIPPKNKKTDSRGQTKSEVRFFDFISKLVICLFRIVESMHSSIVLSYWQESTDNHICLEI